MRRALLVGIDHYEWSPLHGCINDAQNMADILGKHYDGTENFYCKTLVSSVEKKVTKALLLKHIQDLFSREADIALFYFSGHGCETALGGCLVTQDATKYSEGVTVSDIITLANSATKIRQILVILDSCHSGHLGAIPTLNNDSAILRKGISILTSSLHNEYSVQKRGENQSLFTSILMEGLKGGAADLLGNVTAASIYNYTEKLLGPWDQRPVFKSHITEMTPLRYCSPKIPRKILRKITEYFPSEKSLLQLDSSYDPELEPRNSINEEIMAHFRLYLSEGLLKPIGVKHLYHAAKDSKPCQLTPLGQFYWKIFERQKV